MSIKAGRIDYRLLHGIVQGFWCPMYGTQRTMIIDDSAAGNEVRKAALRMSKPAGQALSIISRETAYANFKAGKYDNHTVFVIAADPQIFLDLIELGQEVPILTLGLTELPTDMTGCVQAGRRAVIWDNQVPIYKAIKDAGTTIEVRYMTNDKPSPITDFISI